jgi:hypothetical protein
VGEATSTAWLEVSELTPALVGCVAGGSEMRSNDAETTMRHSIQTSHEIRLVLGGGIHAYRIAMLRHNVPAWPYRRNKAFRAVY